MCKAIDDMIEKTKKKTLASIVSKMLEGDLSLEAIARYTDLSLQDVEKLAKEKSSTVVSN